MTQRLHYVDSAVRKDANQYKVAKSSAVQVSVETGRHCAYNQTRQRFLGADVEAGDFSLACLDARLPTLALNSGAGLWLVPFRGISPTSVRIPVDLVYLNRNSTVIETVESFPISRVSISSSPAASVLVLPAETIRSTETQPGDELILCTADEMKHRLRKLTSSSVDTKLQQTAAPGKDVSHHTTGLVLPFEARSGRTVPEQMDPSVVRTREDLPSQPEPLLQEPQQTRVAEPAQESVKPSKSWLKRLLSPDPPEPRKAPRESLPGLAAYFFTGGAPVAHGVRDISSTGMYVLTNERWYPGTVVRMTITDRYDPALERSITLNSAVVRWGNDGVGLKFVLQNNKDRHHGSVDGADKMQVDQFIQRFRGAKG